MKNPSQFHERKIRSRVGWIYDYRDVVRMGCGGYRYCQEMQFWKQELAVTKRE